MPKKIVKSILGNTKNAARELLKVKKVAFVYLLGSFVLMALVSYISTHTTFYPSLYPKILTALVTTGTDVFFIRLLLKKYRHIKSNLRTLSICFLWSFAFLVLGAALTHAGNFLYPRLAPQQYMNLQPNVVGLFSLVAVYLIMSCFAFYPFLVFEKAAKPMRKNFKMTSGWRLSVAGTWALIWGACYLAKEGVDSLASAESGLFYVLSIFSFTVYAFFLMIASVATAAAYLRAAGEPRFK